MRSVILFRSIRLSAQRAEPRHQSNRRAMKIRVELSKLRFTTGSPRERRSRRASSTAMTKTDADCLRLLSDCRLGSFHRLRDLNQTCPCFRMGFEFSQVLFGPRIPDKGLLFRHGFHSSLIRIDVAIVAARAERFD